MAGVRVAGWVSGLAGADEHASRIPAAVITDPAPDPAHHSAQVLIPSRGVGMNGLFYLAGGAGPHPTMVLLPGFPGNERNLDLAQGIRRGLERALNLLPKN